MLVDLRFDVSCVDGNEVFHCHLLQVQGRDLLGRWMKTVVKDGEKYVANYRDSLVFVLMDGIHADRLALTVLLRPGEARHYLGWVG